MKLVYKVKLSFSALVWILLFPWSHLFAFNPGDGLLERKPNILLILIDDLGWKDLGFMGSTFYETPHLDQMASHGMVFSNAYASASNCAPSRAALFSGQYAPRTGVYTVANSDRGQSIHRKLIPISNTKFLADRVLTIAEVLQQNGYKTAHVGKWHIGQDPTAQGFDVNIGGSEAGNPAWRDMGGYFAPYNNPHLKEGSEREYLTDRLTSEAISFLETVGRQPFFMNFAPYAVHTPIQPKQALERKYQQKSETERHSNAGYAAMIETLDQNIGRLLGYLKQSGKFENTFIIFTSDNGGLYRISRQWPLRTGKGSYYEGGIRVPMVVVWPGKVQSGSTSDQVVSNIDLYPTFLEVASVAKPGGKVLDGVSLLPALKGEELGDRPLYWHFPIYLQAYRQNRNPELPDSYFRTRPGSVMRMGPWKLHEYFEDGRIELYNLETDIGEWKNLKSLYPAKAAALHQRLVQWRQRVDAPVPRQLNPEYRQQEE